MTLIALPPSQELANLVGALGGQWHGRTAMAHCPAHADAKPSLSLRQGNRGILVTCFAGCDRTEILRAISRLPTQRLFPLPTDIPLPRRAHVERLWQEGVSPFDSLGERYLSHRHLRGPLSDIRFHPRCPHGPRPHTLFKPALLVAVREGPQLVAVQRIFLDPNTAACTAKAMLGTPGRGSWQGRGVGPTLAIAEGFETAAAFSELHDVPCWAALGARRLEMIVIPSAVETLLLAGDADFQGREAVARALVGHHREGLRLKPVMPPAPYKDWSDALQASRAWRTADNPG